jgi:hypothetical protein
MILREEYRLRVFEDKVLRIFGPKRNEAGGWRKVHNEVLHNLYTSPSYNWNDQVKEDEIGTA